MQISQRLAEFATSAVPDHGVRRMMGLSVMDWAACAIAGAAEPVAGILRQVEGASGGRAEASVIGMAQRLPVRAAASINGGSSHALDYDDTHFAHIGHPSVAIVPAALAMAERCGASAGEFLDAAVIGAEGSIRVGLWLGRDHYQTGFHQTATAGAFGAAMAVGRVLNLSPGAMAHALGLVATRASGLKVQFGTMAKPYNAGIAAANGVEAALLAEAGFIARTDALEAPQGFGATHAGQAEGSALDGLGTTWRFNDISHKFHACCHGLHAMLEALADLPEPISDPEQVAQVVITTHPRWLSVCNQPSPGTGLEAKFSYRMAAALRLSGYDTGALQTYRDELCADPALVALRDKVVVVGDDSLSETQAHVRLRIGGQDHVMTHDLLAPMGIETRQSKICAKAAALLGAAEAGALWAGISLSSGPDLAGLTARLRAAPLARPQV